MFKYFPHTESDTREMLERIGKKDLDELFSQIDPKLRAPKDFKLPSSLSEYELKKEMERLGNDNRQLISFLGAGSYDTFQFSVCKAITSREEFYTAYTPYQPEISQGTLQYIFEYQSMICELTGMDITNASMYDGATATAEAMFMAVAHTRRNKVLVSSTLNPNIIKVVTTYAKYRELSVQMIDQVDRLTSLEDLVQKLNEEVACVIVGEPNYYGVIEDYTEISRLCLEKDTLLIMNADPSTLPVLKTPRSWGADIACGEAQSLGISLSFGGPYLGYLATTNKLMRKLPGRISGMTKDVDGKRGFVLTLQAREQHIRREKATSNICSNQSLMALHAVVYMSLLGKNGLKEVAHRAYNNAHYLKQQLLINKLFEEDNKQPFFKEFVLKYRGNATKLNEHLLKHQFLGGLILEDDKLLVCASETRTKAEMDEFVRLVGEMDVR